MSKLRCVSNGWDEAICISNVRNTLWNTWGLVATCSYTQDSLIPGFNSPWWGKIDNYGLIGCGEYTNVEPKQGKFDEHAVIAKNNCSGKTGQQFHDCVAKELEKGASKICPGTDTAHFLVSKPGKVKTKTLSDYIEGTPMYFAIYGGGYSSTNKFDTVGYCVGMDFAFE